MAACSLSQFVSQTATNSVLGKSITCRTCTLPILPKPTMPSFTLSDAILCLARMLILILAVLATNETIIAQGQQICALRHRALVDVQAVSPQRRKRHKVFSPQRHRGTAALRNQVGSESQNHVDLSGRIRRGDTCVARFCLASPQRNRNSSGRPHS